MYEETSEKRCETCQYYEYDNWFQSERICICQHSKYCDLQRRKDDVCEKWEREMEE